MLEGQDDNSNAMSFVNYQTGETVFIAPEIYYGIDQEWHYAKTDCTHGITNSFSVIPPPTTSSLPASGINKFIFATNTSALFFKLVV